MIRTTLLTFSFLLSFLLSFAWITQAIENIPGNTMSGTVLRRQDKNLTVQTEKGVLDYNIPDNIKITKNQTETNLENIYPSDKVVITTGNNGDILAVDAVGGPITNWKTTLLPLVGLLLLVLGLILTLWQKKQQGIIKTKPTNIKS